MWTQDYVPLGIERVIKPGGAFPLLTEEEAEKAVQKYAASEDLRPDYENYRSYTDAKAAADAELTADYHLGHLDFDSSRSRLEKRRGRLHPSRIGVIQKAKKDGSTKTRIINDLSRSGINQKIRLRERVVLPRLRDAIQSTRELMQHNQFGIEGVAIDFESAFKQLHVHPDEVKYLSGKGMEGYFAYLRLLFGIVSGPLLWGRVAACLMRMIMAAIALGPREHPVLCG